MPNYFKNDYEFSLNKESMKTHNNKSNMEKSWKRIIKNSRLNKFLKILIIFLAENMLFNLAYAAFDINVFIDNYLIKILMFIIFLFMINFAIKLIEMTKEEKAYTLEEMKKLKNENKVKGFEEIKEAQKDGNLEIDEDISNNIIKILDEKQKFEIIEKDDETRENSGKENKVDENIIRKKSKEKRVVRKRELDENKSDLESKNIDNNIIVIRSKEEVQRDNEKEDNIISIGDIGRQNARKTARSNVSKILSSLDSIDENKFVVKLDGEEKIGNIKKPLVQSSSENISTNVNEIVSNILFDDNLDNMYSNFDNIIYDYNRKSLDRKVQNDVKENTAKAKRNLNNMINQLITLEEEKEKIKFRSTRNDKNTVSFDEIWG